MKSTLECSLYENCRRGKEEDYSQFTCERRFPSSRAAERHQSPKRAIAGQAKRAVPENDGPRSEAGKEWDLAARSLATQFDVEMS